MTLQLHNTLTRTKEPFRPLDDKHVRMYVCGPTVYDDIHIGNARPLVVFDVLYRLLKHSYRDAKVTYVRNITDVDDKIIDRAAESGESIDSLTRRNTTHFHAAAEALGCLKPDKEPRATDHIAQMKAMIETLIAKGYAYEAGGEVLFSVPSMPDYGKLSGRNRDEMIAGARVEVSSHKRDPADFILWKPSTGDQPGWGSDWGRGRPGWHIECSAMSEHYLGQQFDIHGGGVDLVFPHHENEIAQSLCAHPDETFAQVWMHNGYLMSEGEKMSKSLGNFYTVTELLEEFPGEALRLALLKTHYRQPLDFTKDGVREAKRELDSMYRLFRGCHEETLDWSDIRKEGDSGFVEHALCDDLNTPQALSALHGLASQINTQPDQEAALALRKQLRMDAATMGLLQQDPGEWFKGVVIEVPTDHLTLTSYPATVSIGLSENNINELIAARNAARAVKDFAEADSIRDELKSQGVILEDNPDGTTDWRRE